MPRRRVEVTGGFEPRHYQIPFMSALDNGAKFLVWVCHRRGGKDRTVLAQTARMAMQRVGLYWHCLPTLKQARKVIWDGITGEGVSLMRATFPPDIVKKRVEDEMKVELINGSIVQLVGADNFDSLVGSNPVGVAFSEWALTDPRAYEYCRPILRENNGWVAFIFTPRGYNHGYATYQIAKRLVEDPSNHAFCALMTVRDTQVLSESDINLERAMGMDESLVQQEYFCDFSAANVGSIVGKQVAEAERDGRISEDVIHTPGSRVVVSSDIGYRDTAAWWWWQLRLGGFELIHYEEGSGYDADEWCQRLKEVGLPIDRLYLPHDARAKTMATRFTVIERMAQEFDCEIVPRTSIKDRVNAARMVIPRCEFHLNACMRGLECLRAWSYRFDDERKVFSAEPDHTWASHGSDAFSYGAQVLREEVMDIASEPMPEMQLGHPGLYPCSLDDLWADRARARERW